MKKNVGVKYKLLVYRSKNVMLQHFSSTQTTIRVAAASRSTNINQIHTQHTHSMQIFSAETSSQGGRGNW